MTDPDQLPALMSDAEIEIGRKAVFSTENPFCPCDSKTFAKAARWAEARTLATERARADALQAEVEQLRVQLAGCGVAAMGNTRESWARNNEVTQGFYGWSAGYADCLKAAKREIDHRERADALEAALRELLDASDDYANSHLAEVNAINNFSTDQALYSRATIKATKRLSKAEKAARALLEKT